MTFKSSRFRGVGVQTRPHLIHPPEVLRLPEGALILNVLPEAAGRQDVAKLLEV